MSLPILQTKLYAPKPPRQQKIVSRPRLTEKLTAGLVGKLTLISAPAGFGKSTLLSDWIRQAADRSPPTAPALDPARPVAAATAWLTLDADDNDPVRFLLYLIAALQNFASRVGETASTLLQAPGSLPGAPAPKTILTLLLNELSQLAEPASQPHQPYVLVLEDYHVISAQAIHEGLAYLIDHLPPQFHVIITTRADPPLPLARWRARDQLAEIRASDLRFTPDETATFLNDRMGLHLGMADVIALETRIEGWIAGLQLVALSLQGRADKTSFLQTFSGDHRYILNYLTEEVLNQQPRAVQEFLLRTSILDRLCGPLCDAVLANRPPERAFDQPAEIGLPSGQAHAMLAAIERANLFLVPLDDEGQWYRYHPLFAEVLQHRLHQEQPEEWAALHRRASVWYEQAGLLADAIHHALRASDYAHASELIERIWPVTWSHGAVATLLIWVRALPLAALAARPGLGVAYAWALALAGQIEEAEDCLQQIEATLAEAKPSAHATPGGRNTTLSRAAALRAMIAARRGESAQAVALAENALNLIPADAAQLRDTAYYALGLAHQQRGALSEAFVAFQVAARLSVSADDLFLMIAARYHEARIWMAQGQLRMAADTYQQTLALTTQPGRRAPVVGLVHFGYAEILYQWNQLASAADHAAAGLALSPSSSLTYTDGPLHRFSVLARIRQAMGDRAGSLSAIQAAKETAQQTGIALDAERATALEALLHLRLGQLELAAPWAQHYWQTRGDAEGFSYVHEFETLVYVRVLLAQGRVAEVIALLAHWLPAAVGAQHTGSVLELGLLQALALAADGQTTAARQALAHTLALAEPEGYLRLFVDEGEPLRLLILEFRIWLDRQPPDAQQERLSAYIDQVLAAYGPVPPPFATPPIQNPIESLTPREHEVLHLIAAGLANATIAERLVVTVGTVKSHLKHIYGKLGVESRTQAVAEARKLGLL